VLPSHPDRVIAATRFRARWLAETSSTNTVVAEAARAGEPEGLVVFADHQRAGRGRLGRTWVAPPGSALLSSVLLRPPPGLVHLAVTALGCAAAAACARLTGREPGLKWPNDLIVGARKLGGILAEATTEAGNVTGVVVGMGLNTARPPDVPAELRDIATYLDDHVERIPSRHGLLDAILEELEPRYAHLVADGPGELLAEYRRRCVTIGQHVVVQQGQGELRGVAVDVADTAALVVRTEQGAHERVQVGDVVHLRPGEARRQLR